MQRLQAVLLAIDAFMQPAWEAILRNSSYVTARYAMPSLGSAPARAQLRTCMIIPSLSPHPTLAAGRLQRKSA